MVAEVGAGRETGLEVCASRMPLVDLLKAVSSQLIVLHHLAFYGPMSDVAYSLAPGLIDWLYNNARLAVQVFLVLGGFLAARSLAPRGEGVFGPLLPLIWQRYRRLAVPYAAALVVGVLVASLVRGVVSNDSVPASPSLAQIAAHLLFLQDLLDYDALSAGVWYVAIDFQLFVGMVGLLWLSRFVGHRLPFGLHWGPCTVIVLALASLLHFNRDDVWDVWALYFFGAYALGALAYWTSASDRPMLWLILLVGMAGLALGIDFRARIAVAAVVALGLGLANSTGWLQRWPHSGTIRYLARISYAVFLIHFPVLLLMNAALHELAPQHPVMNAIGMLAAWALSLLAGDLLCRLVETR